MSSCLPIVCASSQAVFMAKDLGGATGGLDKKEGRRSGGREGIKASVQILRKGWN